MTLEEAAGYLQKVSAFLREKGHDFTSIGLFDTDDEHTVMLSDIPVEQIEKPGFLDYLRQVQEAQEADEQTKEGAAYAVPTESDDTPKEENTPTVWVE